jgi:cytochrome c-type biogenesis protein CcmH
MTAARRTCIALVALALLVVTPVGALASESPQPSGAAPKTTLPDVEDEVMCPICGTALNLSASPQADRERAYIRREIAAGKTKDQIKDDLVAQYGTQVLAEPPKSGFDLTAWLVPAAALLLAVIGIAIGLRRWRRAGRRPGDPPSDPDDPPLDPSDAKRLDADLARYDL